MSNKRNVAHQNNKIDCKIDRRPFLEKFHEYLYFLQLYQVYYFLVHLRICKVTLQNGIVTRFLIGKDDALTEKGF